jgi:hypothetical protein
MMIWLYGWGTPTINLTIINQLKSYPSYTLLSTVFINMSVIEKKQELVFALVEELEARLNINSDSQYIIGFNDKIKDILRNHTNKYVKTTKSIVYDPSWKDKYNYKFSLHKKTNDYSFIENGIICFALEDSSLEDLTDLISVLDQYFNFDEFKKRYTIYEKIVKSNLFDNSELYLLKRALDGTS